jgi:hypothetical protein
VLWLVVLFVLFKIFVQICNISYFDFVDKKL